MELKIVIPFLIALSGWRLVVFGTGIVIAWMIGRIFYSIQYFFTFINTQNRAYYNAKLLDIDLKEPFHYAKKKFRKYALQIHPDKLPFTATETERKRANESFQEIFDAWQIVREYYKNKE
jgi:preprotein translocase subunit Sec63